MIVSRVALLMMLAGIGYLMADSDHAIPRGVPLATDATDLAQDASQNSARPPTPDRATEERVHPAQRPPVFSDSALRLVAYEPVPVSATIRSDDSSPFQLISPEIKAAPELIPGRWRARNRLLSDVFGQHGKDPDPWINELQTPRLDGQPQTLAAPPEEARAKHDRSLRR